MVMMTCESSTNSDGGQEVELENKDDGDCSGVGIVLT